MISAKLVTALLVAISGYTGYAVPGDQPRIVSLPHAALEERVCGRPCRVMAFTWPNGTIIIDDALRIGGDAMATSILVHELTHFLQMRSVTHPLPTGCAAWTEREREAFEVQARWLRDHTTSARQFSSAMAQAGWNALRVHCVGLPAPDLGP